MFLGAERPSRLTGLAVAVASIAVATAVIYPLEHVAPVISLGVVYLVAVVVVSVFWGLALGVATAVASTVAFNFFHLPPVGTLTLADRRNWVALVALLVVAGATGLVADVARSRAEEDDRRRREADLAAMLARVLLSATRLEDALPVAAQRVAAAVGVSSAAIELREVEADERRTAYVRHPVGARARRGRGAHPAPRPAGHPGGHRGGHQRSLLGRRAPATPARRTSGHPSGGRLHRPPGGLPTSESKPAALRMVGGHRTG